MVALMDERFEEAAASFQLALDLAPSAGLNHAFLAITRAVAGPCSGSVWKLAGAESHDVFRNLAFAMIHHASGHALPNRMRRCRRLIDEFGWTAAYQVAEGYAYRNEVDKAFEWLERPMRNATPA